MTPKYLLTCTNFGTSLHIRILWDWKHCSALLQQIFLRLHTHKTSRKLKFVQRRKNIRFVFWNESPITNYSETCLCLASSRTRQSQVRNFLCYREAYLYCWGRALVLFTPNSCNHDSDSCHDSRRSRSAIRQTTSAHQNCRRCGVYYLCYFWSHYWFRLSRSPEPHDCTASVFSLL